MNLRQLEYFKAVAEELHFGRAAAKMHVAQPPLSQQIRKLEDELGVMLLKRDNRNVSLTPEGGRFLDAVKDSLAMLEDGVEQVRMMASGEIGRVVVGFMASVTQSRFPDAVAEFRELHPGITLELREMNSVEQRRALLDGELDVGMVFSGCSQSPQLCFRVFLSEPYMLAVHRNHPLAAVGEASLEDLDGEALIVFPRDVHRQSYDSSMAVFSAAGVTPRVVQETATHHTKLALVATGLGVGLVPARMAGVCPRGVRLLPFDWQGAQDRKSVLRLAWRNDNSSTALQCFLKVMERYAEPNPAAKGCL